MIQPGERTGGTVLTTSGPILFGPGHGEDPVEKRRACNVSAGTRKLDPREANRPGTNRPEPAYNPPSDHTSENDGF